MGFFYTAFQSVFLGIVFFCLSVGFYTSLTSESSMKSEVLINENNENVQVEDSVPIQNSSSDQKQNLNNQIVSEYFENIGGKMGNLFNGKFNEIKENM